MSKESQIASRDKPKFIARLLKWSVGLVVIYILLYGPLIMLVRGNKLPQGAVSIWQKAYSPVEWCSTKNAYVRKAFEWYANVCTQNPSPTPAAQGK